MAFETPVCAFGWEARPFTLSTPDGKTYTLADMLNGKAFLIAFICNHCPYVQAIIDRFVADVKKLQDEGINVLAVMSNDYHHTVPSDSPEHMKAFAKEHHFSFPYVVDETQEVARAYDAVCTPDFFGFNAEGKLHYRGRLDDARMGDASNRKTELLDAMRQIATTGQGPKKQIPSMGCSIKWRQQK